MRSNYCLRDMSGAPRLPWPQSLRRSKPTEAGSSCSRASEDHPLRIHLRGNPHPRSDEPYGKEAWLSAKADKSSLESYLSQIRQFPLLSQDEEFGLAVRYQKDNDINAAQKLIESNLRFVVKVALAYRSYGIKIPDLIQEGNIGLLMALRKFDPHKGYRFISYAVWWIRAYIQNFIIKNWSLVKIGTTQAEKKLFYKIGKVRKALEDNQEEEKKYETLAREFNVAKEDIIEMEQRMSSRDFSLDSPFDGDQGLTHYDLLQETSPDQEEVLGRRRKTGSGEGNPGCDETIK